MVVAVVGLVLVGAAFLAVALATVVVAGGGAHPFPPSWSPWTVAFVVGWGALVVDAALIAVGKRLLDYAAGAEEDDD